MKKRNGVPIILLTILSILVIFFGQRYSAHQEEQMLDNSLYAQDETEESEESEPIVEEDNEDNEDSQEESTEPSDSDLLAEYEENSDSLSLVETLHYFALSNGEATITYYGNINPNASWYTEMNTFIDNQTDNRVTIEEEIYEELDTYELYIQQTTPNVVETNPNMIIFGMPALPDKTRDMSIVETQQFLSNILDTLIQSLPDTEVVLVEPHPLPGEMNDLNSRSLDYRSYMNTMNEVANEYNLPVLNSHGQFLAAAEETDEELDNLFNEDQLTLNDSGEELYTEVITEEMSASD